MDARRATKAPAVVLNVRRGGQGAGTQQTPGYSPPQQESGEESGPVTKPTTTVRIGSIKAAIWANDTPGGTRHSVTFERLYKSGDAWKTTSSFGRDDLLVLAKVVDLAYSRILDLEDPPESD